MDGIIQGLTQSAIVQNLSEKEHNLKRFTHDIPDNSPFRSIQKVEVPSYVGTGSALNETFRYRIPRRGYLNRMWLKCRIINNGHVNAFHGRGITRFGDFFGSISLFVGGKRIETLYPESIAYNVMTYSSGSCQKNIIRAMAGLESNGNGDDFSRNLSFGYARKQFTFGSGGIDFIIPLDFSIIRHFKDSLDTNFIQNMEIEFKIQESEYQRLDFKSRLVCKYHNLHNVFRTNVRNANHSKETTSKLITRSLRVESTPKFEKLSELSVHTHKPHRYTYTLPNIDDITEILVSFHRSAGAQTALFGGKYMSGPNVKHQMRFRLLVNDKVIVDKAHWELLESNVAAHSNSLGDKLDVSKALSNSGDPVEQDFFLRLSDGESRNYTHTHRIDEYGSWLYVIPFSMFGSDEFYNGSLNAKSLGNVTLEIISEDFSDEPALTDFDVHSIPKVVLRHASLARIDNKTGLIDV